LVAPGIEPRTSGSAARNSDHYTTERVPFEDTHITIAFKTKGTIPNILKTYAQIDKYEKNRVYQMNCISFPLKCKG
jgi:hypothetical protein